MEHRKPVLTNITKKFHRENIYFFIRGLPHEIPYYITEVIFSMLGRRQEFHDYPVLKEVFMEQAYGRLYSAIKPNTTVIDIGANIGDTAIYFAMHPDVKEVYAFEPLPSVYAIAKANIEKTPLKAKIKLINTGIVRSGRVTNVNSKFFGSPGTRLEHAESNSGDTKIRLLSLNEVLKGKKNVVIKSDCEGYEAEIFKEADLSDVYAIELEYHRCKETVTDDLKREHFNVQDFDPEHDQGIIFAKKK